MKGNVQGRIRSGAQCTGMGWDERAAAVGAGCAVTALHGAGAGCYRRVLQPVPETCTRGFWGEID